MDPSYSHEKMSDKEAPETLTTKKVGQDAKQLTKRVKKKCSQVGQMWVMEYLELLVPLLSSHGESKTDTSDWMEMGTLLL